MTRTTGDRIPDATLIQMHDGEPVQVSSAEALGKGKVVLFAMPGAFTGTCSRMHLPNVVEHAEAIRAKGADKIVVLAVNDGFALQAWGTANDTEAAGVEMIADPAAEFTTEMGLVFSNPARGLINRSSRYSMVIEDGVITKHNIDKPGPVCEISSGHRILEDL
jgi:glutaredoxin/glutathione-dependent peroxiredoxin